MKTQSAVMSNEIVSEFRKGVDELLKLVDTLKEDNTRKLYGMFIQQQQSEKRKQLK